MHRLAIVTAAENHFLAANDNHDIANRRIRTTPDRNFRRSIFAGHRNIFFARKPDTGAEMSRLPTKRPQGSAEAGIVYLTLCHSCGSARHDKPPPRISFQAERPNCRRILPAIVSRHGHTNSTQPLREEGFADAGRVARGERKSWQTFRSTQRRPNG